MVIYFACLFITKRFQRVIKGRGFGYIFCVFIDNENWLNLHTFRVCI